MGPHLLLLDDDTAFIAEAQTSLTAIGDANSAQAEAALKIKGKAKAASQQLPGARPIARPVERAIQRGLEFF